MTFWQGLPCIEAVLLPKQRLMSKTRLPSPRSHPNLVGLIRGGSSPRRTPEHAMSTRDWRSAAAYADLETAPMRDIAWEFLRRNPAYRQDWNDAGLTGDDARSEDVAARWGLRFPERPDERPIDLGAVAPGGQRRHGDRVGLAAILLASIASCATGCDLISLRQ